MNERARSTWGWGYADRFWGREQRRAFGRTVPAVLGFDAPELNDPVPASKVELRPSRIKAPARLADICSLRPLERLTHTYGRNYKDVLRGFQGYYPSPPDIVAHPRTEADVMACLDWASDANVAVVPFGGGTSVVGGVECGGEGFAGVMSLDMRHMDRVLDVEPLSRMARIQAGALGPVLQAQLKEHGFQLRHYPQSFEFSTLGGWVATHAGGHYATVYTHIDDLVSATRTITPSGVMQTRRLPGSGAGPNPDRLVMGSEGTLGVITEAWVRLQTRPRFRSGATVHFTDFARAVEATRLVSQSGLFPTNCRLLDEREALLNAVVSQPVNVLILGFESADHPVEVWLERALQICLELGGECPKGPVHRQTGANDASDASRWRQAFFDAPYLQGVLVSLGIIADTFETACTWDEFDALHDDIIRTVRGAMREACGGGLLTSRFTHVYPDGPAPYYTFIAPGAAGKRLEQWDHIKRAASETLMRHGATITHHHAVGRVHKPWYRHQSPDLFAQALKAAKGVLDPAGILNPGCLI